MNSIRAVSLFVASVLSSCARPPGVRAVAADEGPGPIEGTVFYEDGRPAKGATVSAFPLDRGMAAKVPQANTDEKGYFAIRHLWLGKFAVTAMKEDEGYPDTNSGFYSDSKIAPITLSLSHLSATINIRLGPKAGILTGTTSDAATGKPLAAGFWLEDVKDRNKWMGTSAGPNFRVLIPSSKEIKVKVSAPGYEDWVYPDPANPSQVLRLDPGSEIHLDIQLKPAPDKSLPISRFLIPKGYVGWLHVEHDVECASPIPVADGMRIFRFTGTGLIETSSPLPQNTAERRYFYYAEDGSEKDLAADYRSGNGKIWQEVPGSRAGKMSMFIFFVGTEEQLKSRPIAPGFLAPSCH